MGKAIKVKAPAKINLGLKVLRRRSDGYHDLFSVMEQLSLCDTILLEPHHEKGWRFFCSEPSLSGRENIVCRAAALMADRAGRRAELQGVRISLYKSIPVAAGLAGGSSDAAAVLKGLNSFWQIGLEAPELMEIGAIIGSDVPYCLQGGTAAVRGRGEKLSPLPALPFFWVILAAPPGLFLSTAQTYGALESAHLGRPDLEPLVAAIRGQHREALYGWFARNLTNTLEAAVISRYPSQQRLKGQLAGLGFHPAMSGSGPFLFALSDSLISARAAVRSLQEAGNRAALCWTLSTLNKQRE